MPWRLYMPHSRDVFINLPWLKQCWRDFVVDWKKTIDMPYNQGSLNCVSEYSIGQWTRDFGHEYVIGVGFCLLFVYKEAKRCTWKSCPTMLLYFGFCCYQDRTCLDMNMWQNLLWRTSFWSFTQTTSLSPCQCYIDSLVALAKLLLRICEEHWILEVVDKNEACCKKCIMIVLEPCCVGFVALDMFGW